MVQAGTKLVCAVLSLPVPSKSIYPTGEQLSNSLGQIVPEYFDQSAPMKLLLIGCCGSGTSTIFKQVSPTLGFLISVSYDMLMSIFT